MAGGAGLLGSYVIPLAKERGLRVIADAKPEDEELVRELRSRRGRAALDDFAGAIRKVAAGRRRRRIRHRAALPRRVAARSATAARSCSCAGWDGEEVEDRGVRVHPVFVAQVLERTDWLEELRGLASDGRLKLRVAGEYPPEQAAEAHRVMDAGGLRGRAVIVF